jgi:hypothetical protein
VRNKEAVDGDAEGVDDAIDDVETGVGGPAFDVGDGLPAEAGGVSESGLREPGSGAFECEIPTEELP